MSKEYWVSFYMLDGSQNGTRINVPIKEKSAYSYIARTLIDAFGIMFGGIDDICEED